MLERCQARGSMTPPTIHRWIKTACGRAKYAELASRSGLLARLRLGWFVVVAALRDWPLPAQSESSEGSDA